jgi:hypothetical protein
MINATTIVAILSNLSSKHLELLGWIVRGWKADDSLSERDARRDNEDLFCDLGRAGLISCEDWRGGYSYDWTKNSVAPTDLALELFELVHPEGFYSGCWWMMEPRDAYDCDFEIVGQLPLFVESDAKVGGYLATGEKEAWRLEREAAGY